MKIMTSGCAAIIGLMAISLATPAFAQQVTDGATVYVNFTNAPDGIYDPYTGIVNLNNSLGPLVNIGMAKLYAATPCTRYQSFGRDVARDGILRFRQLTLRRDTSDGLHFRSITGGIGLLGYAEVAIVANALLNLPGGASVLDGVTWERHR